MAEKNNIDPLCTKTRIGIRRAADVDAAGGFLQVTGGCDADRRPQYPATKQRMDSRWAEPGDWISAECWPLKTLVDAGDGSPLEHAPTATTPTHTHTHRQDQEARPAGLLRPRPVRQRKGNFHLHLSSLTGFCTAIVLAIFLSR